MEKDVDTQSRTVPLDGHQSERKNPLTGLVEWLPSLAPVWCTDVQFLCYVAPQVTSTGEVTSEWIEALDIMNNDLKWLLLQSHQNFWCQVMYDRTLQKFLDTYVQSAPRCRDEWPKLPAGVEQTVKELNRRVFVTFFRMSTPRETAAHYLSDEAYSSIIYDHYLFDIPKLMDLCVLYGRGNQAALRTMLTTIFQRQPKYTEDLVNAAKGLVQLLNKAADRCHELESGMTDADLADLILYLADISSTLRAFVEVYPSGGQHLEQAGLIERLVHFYESTVPVLQSAWHAHKRSISRLGYLKKRFRQAKCDFSWIVNSLLHLCYLSKADATRELSSSGDALHDGFLHAVSTILSEKLFLREFQKHFSLKDCVQQMQDNHPDLDTTHFAFVLSALGEDITVSETADESLTSSVALEGLIRHVKDVLPELGDSFIEACLAEYQNDAEAVINHILEGTLPPHMHQPSGSAPKVQAASGSAQAKEYSLVSQRANVFDGDNFDIFRRSDIDLSKVSVGKRYDPPSVAAVLSDKSHLKRTRDLYKNFEYETNDPDECLDNEGGAEDYQKLYLFDQYNDEYDDTYDSHNVGVSDSVTTDEVFAVKRLNEKGLFQRHFSSSEDDDKEEEEPSGPFSNTKGMLPSTASRVPVIMKRSTAQNAVAIDLMPKGARREEYAQGKGSSTDRSTTSSSQDYRVATKGKSDAGKYDRRDDQKYGRIDERRKDVERYEKFEDKKDETHAGAQGGSSGDKHTRASHFPEEQSASRDPRKASQQLQGDQTRAVDDTRSRQLKERNKGTKANHNRRNLADRKRNKGMGGPF